MKTVEQIREAFGFTEDLESNARKYGIDLIRVYRQLEEFKYDETFEEMYKLQMEIKRLREEVDFRHHLAPK